MLFCFLIFEAPYRDDKDAILSFISILTSGDNYFQIRQSQWTPVFFFVVFDNQYTNKSIIFKFQQPKIIFLLCLYKIEAIQEI